MEIKLDSTVPPLPETKRGFGLHLSGRLNKTPCLVYGNQTGVILRGIGDHSTWNATNQQHGYKVQAAAFAPNGEWVCSGDASGNVFVWAHESFVVKNEIVVGKSVNDICWSHDGQRIVAVGTGKDDKGKVFPWNTNNKLGELTGAKGDFLTCTFRPKRKFKIFCGTSDFGVYQYKGPPFAFDKSEKKHKNYVNAVRFHPGGDFVVSVSSDKGIHVLDAETGSFVREIKAGKMHHGGSIYSLSFNKDGSQFVTSSADKTLKVWEFESGKLLQTISFDGPVGLMQVSCLWLGDLIYSVSLNGNINVCDVTKDKPIKVVTGHMKGIVDLSAGSGDGPYVFSADTNGRIVRTEMKSNECDEYEGKSPHNAGAKSQDNVAFKHIALSKDGKNLAAVSVNDIFAVHSTADVPLQYSPTHMKLDGASRGLVAGNVTPNLMVCVTHKKTLYLFEGGEVKKKLQIGFDPTCLSLSADDKEAAIGDESNKVHFIDLEDGKESGCIEIGGMERVEITCVSYSPDGSLVALSDRSRWIFIFERNGDLKTPLNKSELRFHNAIVNSLEWSPNGKMLMSAGHDGQIIVYLEASKGGNERIRYESAHSGAVKKAIFCGNDEIVTVGSDASIKFFAIQAK